MIRECMVLTNTMRAINQYSDNVGSMFWFQLDRI